MCSSFASINSIAVPIDFSSLKRVPKKDKNVHINALTNILLIVVIIISVGAVNAQHG